MTNLKTTRNLNNFIDKPAFINELLKTPLSLKAVAQNRFSSELLRDEFKLVLDPSKTTPADGVDTKFMAGKKIITFRRNDIFFDGRKSVMINLRDLTGDESMFKTVRVSKKLQQANYILAQEVVGPIETIG